MNLRSFSKSNLKRRAKILADQLRGLDFITEVEPEDVGLDPDYVHGYSPSGDIHLENLLNDFNITSKDTILDIGCGKGSAMRTMLDFPFARVDGIELAEKMVSIATRNFKRLNSADRVKVFNCDAATFDTYDAYNIVYLFNPFPASVMERVINALIASIDKSEREVVIIYS